MDGILILVHLATRCTIATISLNIDLSLHFRCNSETKLRWMRSRKNCKIEILSERAKKEIILLKMSIWFHSGNIRYFPSARWSRMKRTFIQYWWCTNHVAPRSMRNRYQKVHELYPERNKKYLLWNSLKMCCRSKNITRKTWACALTGNSWHVFRTHDKKFKKWWSWFPVTSLL